MGYGAGRSNHSYRDAVGSQQAGRWGGGLRRFRQQEEGGAVLRRWWVGQGAGGRRPGGWTCSWKECEKPEQVDPDRWM